ncbi:MAG: Gfo/Idh/MocA family oxidoreductase [Rhodothermales bacterium]
MKRRDFLKASAALAAAGSLPDLSYFARQGPRVGLIGSGWYGKTDLLRLIQVAPVEVVSLCDVDREMLDGAAAIVAERQASGNRPATFTDYRAMLDQNDLDLVLIVTPDHWHALPMIEACQAGIDVWVQKPIGVDVVEGQAMVAAARKYGRVVQVGMQRRSTPHLIDARDRYIRTGRLGKIRMVETYCYYHMRTRSNPPHIQPPSYLDYEMWAGPAPKIPYNEVVHPRGWRAFMEYSNGIIGDMCVHMLDMVRWMLGLGWPNRISSSGGILMHPDSIANTPDTQTATFEFEEFPVLWQHRAWGTPADPEYPWGATLYGENGTLKLSVHQYDFIPVGDGEPEHGDVVYELDEYPEDRTEEDLERHVAPAIRRHMLDWLQAVDDRSRPVADIEEGHISAASCILANIALQLGRTLEWDAESGRVVGDEEANALLARPYRDPWVHPHPDAV